MWIPLLAALCLQQTPPPDVLVVTLDDVGLGDVRAFTTPQLDALARQGVSFERAYAMPNCSPARYAALFGRWPRRSGVGGTIDSIDPANSNAPDPERQLLSLAEVFKGRGYATACIGKWHLGRAGIQDGFEVAPHVQGFDDWLGGTPVGVGPDGYYSWTRVDNGVVEQPSSDYATNVQRDRFVDWWQANEGRPRFAWLAFGAAHAPWDPPPGSVNLGTPRQRFRAVVEYLDGALGACLAAVDLEHTLVVLWSDNGTPTAARPAGSPPDRWKGSTYEGGVRVPLIVAGPGIRRGTSQALVSAVDFAATLFDLLDWETPSGTFEDSRSFARSVRRLPKVAAVGEPVPPRRSWLLVEHYQTGLDDLALIEERWKLRLFDPDGAEGPAPSTAQVFDLLLDPEELAPHELDDPAVAGPVERLLLRLSQLPDRAAR